jgi:hypothetical protein
MAIAISNRNQSPIGSCSAGQMGLGDFSGCLPVEVDVESAGYHHGRTATGGNGSSGEVGVALVVESQLPGSTRSLLDIVLVATEPVLLDGQGPSARLFPGAAGIISRSRTKTLEVTSWDCHCRPV